MKYKIIPIFFLLSVFSQSLSYATPPTDERALTPARSSCQISQLTPVTYVTWLTLMLSSYALAATRATGSIYVDIAAIVGASAYPVWKGSAYKGAQRVAGSLQHGYQNVASRLRGSGVEERPENSPPLTSIAVAGPRVIELISQTSVSQVELISQSDRASGFQPAGYETEDSRNQPVVIEDHP